MNNFELLVIIILIMAIQDKRSSLLALMYMDFMRWVRRRKKKRRVKIEPDEHY